MEAQPLMNRVAARVSDKRCFMKLEGVKKEVFVLLDKKHFAKKSKNIGLLY
jgi:hypothetical protein